MRAIILCFASLVLAVFGAGAVLAEDAPEAAAPRAQTVCQQCHAGLPGHLGAPVRDWAGSVHSKNGISCHDCHGGDPTDFAMAMSPERGFIGAPEPNAIPDFCGRCHIGVRQDYGASKHGKALGKGGPQCVTCHSNHAVKRASLALINEKSCTRCHSFERAARIRAALEATDGMIAELEKDLDGLHRVGIAVKAMRGKVFSARNSFHRLFHSVDVDKVHEGTAAVQADLEKVEVQIAGIKSELGQRKVWGGIAVVLLVVAGILALLLRRTYEDEEKSG